ncbi:unnamed protein product, partial [marine sediment metagenome]
SISSNSLSSSTSYEPFENLKTFTEIDSASDITINPITA